MHLLEPKSVIQDEGFNVTKENFLELMHQSDTGLGILSLLNYFKTYTVKNIIPNERYKVNFTRQGMANLTGLGSSNILGGYL
jgi:hypothetical protein